MVLIWEQMLKRIAFRAVVYRAIDFLHRAAVEPYDTHAKGIFRCVLDTSM